jgi:hypothetical protein
MVQSPRATQKAGKRERLMRKLGWVVLLLGLATVWMAGTGLAAVPSLLGGTGLVAVPNAWVVPQGNVEVGAAVQSVSDASDSSFDMWIATLESGHAWSGQVVGGMTRGTEVWIDLAQDNTPFSNHTWSFGGKYQMPVRGQHYCLAVGAARRQLDGSATVLNDVLEPEHDDQSLSSTDLYVVGTAEFRLPNDSEWANCDRWIGSFGLMYKRGSASESWAGDDYRGSWSGGGSLFEPFLGIDIPNDSNTMHLGAEYRWGNNSLEAQSVFSAYLEYDFSPTLGVQLGSTNADQLGFGSGDRTWFANVGYTFGYGH